jgi:6-phosphofructokinase 1
MAQSRKKGSIAILTGGGDVPGLNPAIRAITIRALREGYQVIGLKRGWAGIMELVRDKKADNSDRYMILTEEIVNKAGRTEAHSFIHQGHVPATFPKHMYRQFIRINTPAR